MEFSPSSSQAGPCMTSSTISNLGACHECDLLYQKTEIPIGHTAYCPRCRCTLYANKVRSLSRAAAWALTGLILFIPANAFPIIKLKVLGQEQGATLINGVQTLAREGHVVVAVLTFLVSIAAPLLKLLLLSGILWRLRRPGPKINTNLPGLFRFYHKLDTWAMLEVYMLGLLIAFTKLGDLAEVITGIGLYSFIGLMLVSILASITLDEDEVWQTMEAT